MVSKSKKNVVVGEGLANHRFWPILREDLRGER